MARPVVNVAANSAGLVVQMTTGVIFSAVFFRILGAAGFGLVSFCTLIITLGSQLADLGIGRTVTRELARRKECDDGAAMARNALFTLQVLHALLAVSLGLVIFLASGWLARHWLQGNIPADFHPTRVIALTGLLAAVQLPIATASAALNGLERHITRNVIIAFFSICQGLGVLMCLFLFGGKPFIYVSAQCAFAAAQLVTFTVVAWRLIPRSENPIPQFSQDTIRESWAFATNDGLATLVGMAVMNGDRIILSNLLPLHMFGGYALVVSLSSILYRIPSPINITYFPRFVVLFSSKHFDQLRIQYRRATMLLQIVIAPVLIILVAFSTSVLELVASRRLPVVGVFAMVLSLRALGTGVNAMTQVPYTLLLSAGRSDLGLWINLAIALIYLSLLELLVPRFGIVAASALWLAASVVGFLPCVMWAHRYSGIRHMREWFTATILPTMAVSVVVVIPLALLMPEHLTAVVRFLYVALTGVLAIGAVAFAVKDARKLIIHQLSSTGLLGA